MAIRLDKAVGDFGKAADDARHRAKLKNIYSPQLAAHLDPGRLERQTFFGAYQFYRNLWHVVRADGNRLKFLVLRSSDILWKQLKELLLGVAPCARSRISVVAIEDVLANLSDDDLCPKGLREYATKLKQKSLIGSTP